MLILLLEIAQLFFYYYVQMIANVAVKDGGVWYVTTGVGSFLGASGGRVSIITIITIIIIIIIKKDKNENNNNKKYINIKKVIKKIFITILMVDTTSSWVKHLLCHSDCFL